MNIFQDISDLLLVGFLFSPPYGWFAVIALLFLGGALKEYFSTEEGKVKWQAIVANNRRITFVSVFVLIAVVMLFQFMTSGSHGQCSRDGKSPTDEEFIRVALRGNIRLLTFPNEVTDLAEKEKIINSFLSKNPDCCKVFRERSDELEWMSWADWRDSVVVRARNEKSLNALRRGEKIFVDDGISYARVNNCLHGTHVIEEMIPGG